MKHKIIIKLLGLLYMYISLIKLLFDKKFEFLFKCNE